QGGGGYAGGYATRVRRGRVFGPAARASTDGLGALSAGFCSIQRRFRRVENGSIDPAAAQCRGNGRTRPLRRHGGSRARNSFGDGSLRRLRAAFLGSPRPVLGGDPCPVRWTGLTDRTIIALKPPVRRARRRTDKLWPSALIATFPGSSGRALPRGRAAYCGPILGPSRAGPRFPLGQAFPEEQR